ncbi:hypothetical protein EZV62_011588 [Acer yangbiense]|uniref:Uncharacterized protein n=1 Tax=Acer yangbiense TaxID=1000413 RepID=A0A5C7I646_9ROSI|nr:hypothetical protein EZV62_011588 [Acer yangbiense]
MAATKNPKIVNTNEEPKEPKNLFTLLTTTLGLNQNQESKTEVAGISEEENEISGSKKQGDGVKFSDPKPITPPPLKLQVEEYENPAARLLLEKSLSEILTLFYPLAGRYIKENLSVSCNDEGVEYIEALVNSQLSPILLGEFETKELNCFLPDELEESAISPLVAIQVNIFNYGGLAIGLRLSHRIIDGFTCSMFMNGWAKACKVGLNDVTIPNFESGILFPPRDLSGFQFLHSPKTKSHELVTKMFSFDEETISKLKIEAGCKPSTTEVLTALIMRAKINAAAARARNRTCLLLVREQELGLNNFVDQVRDAIRDTMMEYAKKESSDEDGFFSKVVKQCIDIVEETREGELDVHMFSSVMSLPFHQADFGWGMPDWVSMGKMSSKSVFFIARSNGSGDKKGLIEAWVTMDKDDMACFEKDPSIVMSTKSASTKIAIAIPILRPRI